MAHFIRIDNEEDFKYLQRFVSSWHFKCQGNISAYVEFADMFQRLHETFEQPILAEEVSVTKEVTKPVKIVKKKSAAVVKTNFDPKLCSEHPKYGALRAPRTDCEGCWQAFERYAGAARSKQARTKFDRQRKKLSEDNN